VRRGSLPAGSAASSAPGPRAGLRSAVLWREGSPSPAARGELLPLLAISVLFAELVGFTALVSARIVFPAYARLPYAVRIALQVLTLLSGTVFGSAGILAAQPYFALARTKTIVMVVLANAAAAVLVGISLHTYDTLKRQLEESMRKLREREALERELEIAREVQRELLPRQPPNVAGLELGGLCLPAVGVGGDYYDFLPFAEDRVGIVVADVSGKGIPAALLMAGLQASVRTLALPSLSPAEINRRLNDLLLRSTSESRYATLFLAFYDGRSQSLVYSNAGHYPPLHLGRDGFRKLREGGQPLGLLEESRYGEGAAELAPGDLLVLYTDGVVEASGPNGDEFGEGRLAEVVRRNRHLPLPGILSTVISELERFRGGVPPHDDITLVLARVR